MGSDDILTSMMPAPGGRITSGELKALMKKATAASATGTMATLAASVPTLKEAIADAKRELVEKDKGDPTGWKATSTAWLRQHYPEYLRRVGGKTPAHDALGQALRSMSMFDGVSGAPVSVAEVNARINEALANWGIEEHQRMQEFLRNGGYAEVVRRAGEAAAKKRDDARAPGGAEGAPEHPQWHGMGGDPTRAKPQVEQTLEDAVLDELRERAGVREGEWS